MWTTPSRHQHVMEASLFHTSVDMAAETISLHRDTLEHSRRKQEDGQKSEGETVMYHRRFDRPVVEVASSRKQEEVGEAIVDRINSWI